MKFYTSTGDLIIIGWYAMIWHRCSHDAIDKDVFNKRLKLLIICTNAVICSDFLLLWSENLLARKFINETYFQVKSQFITMCEANVIYLLCKIIL